jgi:uncharacterized membrane protein
MLGKLIVSFLISASPLGEAKVGLPYALSANVNDIAALLFCMAGNLMVYPIIELFMSTVGKSLFKKPSIKRKVIKLRNNTKARTQDLVDKYGFWGLMVFVAVPLPGTGAYFGTIAAYVFEIDKAKAFKAISIGVIITTILLFLILKGAIKGLEFLL